MSALPKMMDAQDIAREHQDGLPRPHAMLPSPIVLETLVCLVLDGAFDDAIGGPRPFASQQDVCAAVVHLLTPHLPHPLTRWGEARVSLAVAMEWNRRYLAPKAVVMVVAPARNL